MGTGLKSASRVCGNRMKCHGRVAAEIARIIASHSRRTVAVNSR